MRKTQQRRGDLGPMPRYVRFSVGDTVGQYGLLTNQEVVELDGSLYTSWTTTNRRYPVDQVKLLPPCEPTKIVCVGTNYKQVLAAKEKQIERNVNYYTADGIKMGNKRAM